MSPYHKIEKWGGGSSHYLEVLFWNLSRVSELGKNTMWMRIWRGISGGSFLFSFRCLAEMSMSCAWGGLEQVHKCMILMQERDTDKILNGNWRHLGSNEKEGEFLEYVLCTFESQGCLRWLKLADNMNPF